MSDKSACLFIHGMGVDDDKWIDRYTAILGKQVPACLFHPVSYGQIVNSVGLTTLAVGAADSEISPEDIWAIGFAEGYLTAQLNVSEAPNSLAPMGMHLKNVTEASLNTYKYATRYLLGLTLKAAVFHGVSLQVKKYIQDLRLAKNSVLLMGHSLGSVVGLDLLKEPSLAPYFRRYITTGSPLGGIARLPLVNQRFLPEERRKIDIEWINVAAPDDKVALFPIQTEQGFSGRPLRQIMIRKGYPDPHGAYYHVEEAVQEWAPTAFC